MVLVRGYELEFDDDFGEAVALWASEKKRRLTNLGYTVNNFFACLCH